LRAAVPALVRAISAREPLVSGALTLTLRQSLRRILA
jgi:hypothetical protein